MMTADFSRGLPDLRAGVYRHWKGHHYLVLGYAHDANADDLIAGAMIDRWLDHAETAGRTTEALKPIGERTVVVYVGLELDDANTGPRLAVRTAEDFFALVCSACGDPWECNLPHVGVVAEPVARFEYLGPAWYGWRRAATPDPDPPASTLRQRIGLYGEPARPDVQPWAPCPILAPHEPHGPVTTVRCPGVPRRHPALPMPEVAP